MKTFTAQIFHSGLVSAITYLPGWSHAGKITKRHVSYYPFEVDQIQIYFKAKHRTEAARQLSRCPFTLPRDLCEWSPESPEAYIRRKVAAATEICKAETLLGNYSRLKFLGLIIAHGKATA
jgi:hypothetical protein